MKHTAKLFMYGKSQAIALPENYRFYGDEVFIKTDEETGDIIISKKQKSWEEFFKMIDSDSIPDDFMSERDNELPQERNLF